MVLKNTWRQKHSFIISTARIIFKNKMNERLFTSHFGVLLYVCAFLFHRITNEDDHCNYSPLHLLMALHFLKTYNAEGINSTLFGCSDKTLRKHCWNRIKILSNLGLINWEDEI